MMRKKSYIKWPFVRLSVKVAGVACALGALMPLATNAAPWEYGVDLDVGLILTDNIFLADDGLEESETAFTIAPEFFLSTDGETLEADIRYRPEAYFYSDNNNSDNVFHSLDASLTSALIRERFFVYLSAVNFQSIITPEAQFPTTNLPISGNRIDSRVAEARPYWQQRVGKAELLIEAAYVTADYDDELFQSNNERGGRFRLDNLARQQGFAWGLDYRYRRMEYEVSTPWEFQRAAIDLGFWVNGSTRIFSVGGAETSFEDVLESNLDESFWEAGFQYRPNQRLNLEIAVGDRSYGTSYRGEFSYALRRGDVSFTYNEGPATRGEVVFDRRPLLPSGNLDNILDQAGSSDRFIRRRGEFLANIELSKSELTLRIFAETRESRTTADGVVLSDEDYHGATLRWTWNFGAKTAFGIGFDVSERGQTDRSDELLGVRVDLAYNFTQRMSIRLEGIHSEQNGKGTSTFDYRENQLRLLLRTSF